MDFGFNNDTQNLYKIKVQQTSPAKFPNGKYGTEYHFVMELNSVDSECMAPPINLQVLQTLAIPNYFPPNEILTRGWMAGQRLFEKNWTDVLNMLALHHWEDSEFSLVANNIKNFVKANKSNTLKTKNFVTGNIPQSVQMLLINSYFCHVWNSVLSQRMETIGLQPLVGDLFCDDNKQEIKLVNQKDLEHIDVKNVVLPVPGIPNTRYPTNMAIKDIYSSSIPKFDSTWFNKRIKEFQRCVPSYRPMLCHLIGFEFSWASQKEFSLRFKLADTNSCENVLRGLRTCFQFSQNCSLPSQCIIGRPPQRAVSDICEVSTSTAIEDQPAVQTSQESSKTPPMSAEYLQKLIEVAVPSAESLIKIKEERMDGGGCNIPKKEKGRKSVKMTTKANDTPHESSNKKAKKSTRMTLRSASKMKPTQPPIEIITISDSDDEPATKRQKNIHQQPTPVTPLMLITNIKKEKVIDDKVRIKLEKPDEEKLNLRQVKQEPGTKA